MKPENDILLSTITLSLAALCLLFAVFAAPPVSGLEIEPEIQRRMASNGAAGYLIYFRERSDVSGASAMEWEERGKFVADTLKTTSENTQARIRRYLDSHNVSYRSYWIANVIVVEKSDEAVLEGLGAFSEIESIATRRSIPAPVPVPVARTSTKGSRGSGVEPNLTHVNVDQVWAAGYDGSGIVIGIVDSGVRYTHKALVGKYRGNLGSSFDHNYNWWDPQNRCNGTPCGATDHGTHVTGIVVGDDGSDNRTGMAPGAKWIACLACGPQECTDNDLFACGQFMLAPTDSAGNNPDPTKRPHIINNSWNSGPGDRFYWAVISNWQAAGIYPVFANGNAGPGCGTVGSPGDYPMVTSVGNIDHTTDLPSNKSSRGPTVFQNTINPIGYPYLKPLISAPGMNIRSAFWTGDEDYKAFSGTSMAAPHVTGLVALMLQAAPCLTYTTMEMVLAQTASSVSYASGCGQEGPGNIPNNATGWGVIDAFKAVNEVLGICGGMGALQGVVSSQSAPLTGALVTTGSRLTATSDSNGYYTIPHLPAGTQTLTVSAPGFYETATTVAIAANVTSTKNVSMKPKPKITITGRVLDGSGAGWPLSASIAVSSPGSATTVVTNPVTGRYSVTLLGDTVYSFAVTSEGYDTGLRTVTASTASEVQDFSLKANRVCSAPGYEESVIFHEEFEGSFPPAGWTTVPLGSNTNVWHRNDYFNTPNQTNGSGFCAQVGVDYPSDKWDAALLSPSIVIPADTAATLFYENLFWSSIILFETRLDVTNDGGATWHNLTSWTKNRGPLREQVDLSGFAGKTIQVRWHYSTKDHWSNYHQQIDNVKVTAACRSKAKEGGLIVGKVYDANTRKPLAGVTVSNELNQSTTTDTSGAYVLFSSSGTHVLGATPSWSAYGPASLSAFVRQGRVAKRDFYLPAGKLASTPEQLTVTLSRDSQKTVILRLANKGGKAASYQFTNVISGTGTTLPEVGRMDVSRSDQGVWLSESPASGIIAARRSASVKVAFDSTGLPAGTYNAQIRASGNIPYDPYLIPVTMNVADR